MQTISTTRGRVFVTMEVRPILRLQKKKVKGSISKRAWTMTEKIVVSIFEAETLCTVATGVSVRSEKETDKSPAAQARAAKLAFKRALRYFPVETDRVALWKAWGV